ncbi:MAG: phosphoribosylformylglycinamidine cyclo-ligase [Planctomycetota bacterium]|nr:MAG: phosphoribosylformylglycinamidine cyclo-ligase [Planctomycetota bacterium]
MSKSSRYREAGVDIDAKYDAVTRAKDAIRTTFTEGVVSDIGSFGGLFDPARVGAEGEILVASADGVGTKVKVAAMTKRYDSIGACLVNHCVNDILVQGARPLFFLDYVGCGKMQPTQVGEILQGLARACRENGLALLGGETAEMPGMYEDGDFEVVGTIVGSVRQEDLLDGSRVQAGDVIISLPSSGLHTNGYSLARRILFEELGHDVQDAPGEIEGSLAAALLAEHKSYLKPVLPLLQGSQDVHACAHITGGGLFDNIPRVLPEGIGVEIDVAMVQPPAIFRYLMEHGNIERNEAYRVFNMGFGFVLLVDPKSVDQVMQRLVAAGEAPVLVGEAVAGSREVQLR